MRIINGTSLSSISLDLLDDQDTLDLRSEERSFYPWKAMIYAYCCAYASKANRIGIGTVRIRISRETKDESGKGVERTKAGVKDTGW